MARSLQKELKQKKPFTNLEDEAYVALVRTTDMLAYDTATLFKAHGITGTQYNVLRILRGSSLEGLSCQEIGQRLITKVPDVTRLLDRLEQQDFIRRERQSDDRRVVKVWINEKGLALLDKLDAPVEDIHLRQFSHIGKEKLQTLIAILAEIRDPC